MLTVLATLYLAQIPPLPRELARPPPSVENVLPVRQSPPRKKRRGYSQRVLRPAQEGTPIVLSFDGAPVEWRKADRPFELEPGEPRLSAWPTAKTPWLVRDLNHDGKVNSGRELFGSATLLPNGLHAVNGFEALAALDDGDGVIDARDPVFSELLLWRDEDGDRKVGQGELTSLKDSKVTRIELGYSDQPACDVTRGCVGERSKFFFQTAEGEREGLTIDVHLWLLPVPSS